MSSAASGPASRGRRWVPPAPGTMPIRTSGSPTNPSGAIRREWQASAPSNPPPSAVPWIAATTGLGLASSAWTISCVVTSAGPPADAPADAPPGAWSNSRISAPAMKVRPSQASTAACRLGSARIRASAAISPLRTACDSAFTGG